MIRSGTVAVSERLCRFRRFRKFNRFRGFLFNGLLGFSGSFRFWVHSWFCDNEERIGICRPQCGVVLPGDFSGYLRKANGELKETLECLGDGGDRGYFTSEQIVPLQRLCKRRQRQRLA